MFVLISNDSFGWQLIDLLVQIPKSFSGWLFNRICIILEMYRDLIKSVVSLLKSSMSTPNANVVELIIMQLFRTKEYRVCDCKLIINSNYAFDILEVQENSISYYFSYNNYILIECIFV